MTTLHIKNMVCDRCVMVVKATLEKLQLHPTAITLGEVTLSETDITDKKAVLSEALDALGFELMDDKRYKIIEQVKNIIREVVHQKDNDLDINLSDLIAQTLHQDYHQLSNLFSETENTTIEKYYIAQKIERVKELLLYNELSLSEISYQLKYSSVAHLSNQFKKVTGMTPTQFKQQKTTLRKPLDKV